jgi:fermentation-respiration switch protein FrsA (DUF1100 family)
LPPQKPKLITGTRVKIVTMRRRNFLLGLTATAGLAACTGKTDVVAAAPILASTTASSLAPKSVTPYVPPVGQAPWQRFDVGLRDLHFTRGDRSLPVRIWFPTAPGRYPLVLFSHGLTSQPSDFNDLLTRWAQAGFVVAGPKYPHTSYEAPQFDSGDIVNQPADASFVLDSILGLGVHDPLPAILDPQRIAAAGHSGGAITTAGLFSAHRDVRLKAGIVVAGTDFQGTPFTGPAAGMLFVHGRKDDTVSYGAGHTVFEAVPWSRSMLTITDGGHTISGDAFEVIARASTEFLRWSLYGDAKARARLPQAAATGGVATLDDQL